MFSWCILEQFVLNFMLQRGPQLLSAAFSQQIAANHPLIRLSIQSGARLYSRMLKMSWIHDKAPVTIPQFNQFYAGDISLGLVGLELLLELLREIVTPQSDIYSQIFHRQILRNFSKEPLTFSLKTALSFITSFKNGTYASLEGIFHSFFSIYVSNYSIESVRLHILTQSLHIFNYCWVLDSDQSSDELDDLKSITVFDYLHLYFQLFSFYFRFLQPGFHSFMIRRILIPFSVFIKIWLGDIRLNNWFFLFSLY